MGLTRRDAVAAVLAAAAVLVLLAVTLSWDWPLITGYRSGTVALWVLGVAMCPLTWIGLQAAFGDDSARAVLQTRLGLNRTYYTFMSALGFGATVLLVWGVVAPGPAVFAALAAVVIGLWLISTARRLIAPPSRTPAAV